MGRARSSNHAPDRADHPQSVTVEVEGVTSPGHLDWAEAEAGSRQPLPVRARSLAFLALAILCGLAAVLIGSSTSGELIADPPASTDPSTTVGRAASVVETETPLVDQLPTVPDAWVDGLVLGWVDLEEELQLRAMVDGADLPASTLAENILPPLPARIHLLGGENATWMIDLEQPMRSGKLSNTVRMVRLGQDLDSYGFISTSSDITQFFVGSLWGPAMNGTAQTPASSTVLTVPRTGIVVSSTAAESALVVGGGLSPLPSRLGRIVAASEARVAGIHCDDLGRCVGRVADWDGSNEVQISADTLALPVVALSPDGRFVLGIGRGEAPRSSNWILHDLDQGTSQSWESPTPVDASLVWSPRSDVVFWLDDGVLLARDLVTGNRSVGRVRQVDRVGPRLDKSDLLVLER